MANTFTLIASSTVGSGGAASIDFTSIPSTYTDLVVKLSGRDDRAGQPNGDFAMQVGYNGTINTGSIYSMKRIGGNGSSAFSDSYSGTYLSIGMLDSATATANTFASNEVYIPNYTSSNYKSISVDGASENNDVTAFAVLNAGLISTSNPITDIKIFSRFGTILVQYSTAYLYGVKNA